MSFDEQALMAWIRELPVMWALLALSAAAASEYLLPPLPADSVLLGGALLVVAGTASFSWVWAAAVVGGLLGGTIQWGIGRLVRRPEGGLRWHPILERAIPERHVQAFADQVRRYGPAILVLNRGMPGIRGAAFLAVGAAGVSLPVAWLYGGISQALWSAAILALGVWVGDNVDLLLSMFERAQLWIFGGVGLALLIWFIARRWNTTDGGSSSPPS
ncbi:MAG: DedA family protein [Myxococcota bacterium]